MASPARKPAPREPSPVPGLFVQPEKRTVVLSLALVLTTLVIYFPAGKNAFINFDDNHYITANPHVTSGLNWATVKWAFTTFDAGNWHPLTWLSHALDFQMFGLNPAGHHFVNVLLHGLNAVLLFLVLQALTGFTWRSVTVALLFVVHPLNVESVAWAAERKTLLATCFFLLATWAYLSYVRTQSRKKYVSVLALFAFALMSKPQVITFPFALLLLDFWPLRRARLVTSRAARSRATSSCSLSELLIEKVPLFALAALSAVVTLFAQHAGNAVRTFEEYSLVLRLETAVTSYLIYIGDTFFPHHLAPIYPHATALLPAWQIALSLIVLAGTTAATIVLRKTAPYFLFGWLWFLGTLVPMIGLVQVGLQARADRYLYISIIGILVAVVWGAADFARVLKLSPSWPALLAGFAAVALSLATLHQVTLWRNSETLWKYTLSVTHDNFMAEDNLAQELAHQGRTQEAIAHFQHILSMHAWRASDLIAFGAYIQRNGYFTDAIGQYERAFQTATDMPTRALALSNIGSAYLDLKNNEQAERNFQRALQLDPKNVPALLGTVVVAEKKRDFELAIQQCATAVSIQPSDLGYELLGRAYEQSGKSAEAAAAYAQAQRLSSNYEQTRSLATHLLTQ
jgi:tetratricopeptide (TPR) repeat protein